MGNDSLKIGRRLVIELNGVNHLEYEVVMIDLVVDVVISSSLLTASIVQLSLPKGM